MELKRLRKEAGLNLDEVAKQLGVHASTISRMESGDRGLKRDDLAAVLVIYGATRKLRMAMLHLYDQAEQPGLLDNTDLVLPDSLVALVGFEEDATSIRNYETLLIPGLAQTIPYARAVIEGSGLPLEDEEMDDRLVARVGRQSLLRRRNAPMVRLLINEAALRQNIGGPEVMRGQLEYLAELRGRLNIRVVPTAAGAHPGLGSAFTILDYEFLASLVAIENKVSTLYLDDAEHVAPYKLAFDGILAAALSVDASVELIRRISDELPLR
jgi:transcriptional regulator with XRE-family HTH domain